MQMAYWMRIATGAGLGLVALLCLWPTLGITWLTALAAALAAPVGFLGSYFVVSADRPEEGYEQVLFDRPNTIVSAVMLVLFAGAGFGTGLLAPEEPSATERVLALRAEYEEVYDAWTSDAEPAPTLERLAALRVESDRIQKYDLAALPEGAERAGLEAANDAYAFAIDGLRACVEEDARSCRDARVRAANAEIALQSVLAPAPEPEDEDEDEDGKPAETAGEAPEA